MTHLETTRAAVTGCEISEKSEISSPLNPDEAERLQAVIIALACGPRDQLDRAALDRLWARWKVHEAALTHLDAEREAAA